MVSRRLSCRTFNPGLLDPDLATRCPFQEKAKGVMTSMGGGMASFSEESTMNPRYILHRPDRRSLDNGQSGRVTGCLCLGNSGPWRFSGHDCSGASTVEVVQIWSSLLNR